MLFCLYYFVMVKTIVILRAGHAGRNLNKMPDCLFFVRNDINLYKTSRHHDLCKSASVEVLGCVLENLITPSLFDNGVLARNVLVET